MFRRLLFALVLVALFLPAVALAEQIASYTIQTAPGSEFAITNNGGASETISVQTVTEIDSVPVITPGAQIQFQFATGVDDAFGTSNIDATLMLNLTTSAAPVDFGSFVQETFAGTFSIMDNSTDLYLLLGSVSGGNLFGTVGFQAISFDFSAPPTSNVVFSSAYLSFASAISAGVSFSMTDVTPVLSVGAGGYLASATAEGGGSFSSDPPPVIAPEPTTWLLGSGALLGMGLLLWRQRRKTGCPIA